MHPVTRNMIYRLLHRYKWRKIVSRSRCEKKVSEEAIEAYKKITGKIKSFKKSRSKLRVIFRDEAGFVRGNVGRFSLVVPSAKTGCMNNFLEELSKAYNEIFKCLEAVIDRLCLTMRDLAEDARRAASITQRK